MIRQLRQDEIDQFLEMTQIAFNVAFTEEDLKQRSRQVIPEQIWGYYLEERLAARVAILPLHIYLQGVKFSMGGIAHVATYPELRRHGMVGKLMDRSLEEMKLQGQTVSMLNPFAFGFYRKYGWEWFCDLTTYSIETAHFPRFQDVRGRVKRGNAEELKTISWIYDQYAPRYNGMLARDEAWWKTTVLKRKLGQLAIAYSEEGDPLGYMFYTIKERRMRVSELVALSHEGRQLLWQFIGNHDSIVDAAEYSAPAQDSFALLLGEPAAANREYFPYFMFRIVDLAGFLPQYPFHALAQGTQLEISVKDTHAPWNEGSWTLRWLEGGQVTVLRLDVNESDAKGKAPHCTLDIRALSAIVCGFQRPSAMAEIGRAQGDAEAIGILEQAIPRRVPHLIDMF